jgi:hypothetical protein
MAVVAPKVHEDINLFQNKTGYSYVQVINCFIFALRLFFPSNPYLIVHIDKEESMYHHFQHKKLDFIAFS